MSCNASGRNGTRPTTVPRPKPTVDPALQGFLDGYQEALADGTATQTGSGEIDGKNVIWLSFPPAPLSTQLEGKLLVVVAGARIGLGFTSVGVYVTIRASSHAQVLAAAKALQPAG